MTPADYEYIYRLLRERSAIVLETGKEYLVDSRLIPLVEELKLDSVMELVGRLRVSSDNELRTRVVEAMVTTETSFFRDHHPFETLRLTVLPELFRKRADSKQLDIWCAACSSGQEPYSLAIMLRENFPNLSGWRINILATDLSKEVLGRAKEGRYHQVEVNRGLPATLLARYFRQNGTEWQLAEDIRRMVEFRELNLATAWPPLPRMDLLFIRNVMIYFDLKTKKSILGQAAQALRPDGYLLLGGAETTLNLDDSYRRVESLKGGFFQQVG